MGEYVNPSATLRAPMKTIALYLTAAILLWIGLAAGLQISPGWAYTLWAVAAAVAAYATLRLIRRS